MRSSWLRATIPAVLAWLMISCASMPPGPTPPGQPDFHFGRDTFAFRNEVLALSPGQKNLFALRCFVMSCAANRFWKFARFAPDQPRLGAEEYGRLIYQVAHQPFYKQPFATPHRIVIPGYANLFEFSRDYQEAFKQNIGSKTISCLSYRNWRMSLGVTSAHQARTAQQIKTTLDNGLCDQVHIVDWPELNHSVLVYSYRQLDDRIVFTAYDPNAIDTPLAISFDMAHRYFSMPATRYYRGGRISVHRIYYAWWR